MDMNADQQDATAFAREIGQRFRSLAALAWPIMADEVNGIIGQADRDNQRIEHCLDHLLQYCYDDRVLSLFRQLCRYYYTFNPAVSVQYIYFYREMWNSADAEQMEEPIKCCT